MQFFGICLGNCVIDEYVNISFVFICFIFLICLANYLKKQKLTPKNKIKNKNKNKKLLSKPVGVTNDSWSFFTEDCELLNNKKWKKYLKKTEYLEQCTSLRQGIHSLIMGIDFRMLTLSYGVIINSQRTDFGVAFQLPEAIRKYGIRVGVTLFESRDKIKIKQVCWK